MILWVILGPLGNHRHRSISASSDSLDVSRHRDLKIQLRTYLNIFSTNNQLVKVWFLSEGQPSILPKLPRNQKITIFYRKNLWDTAIFTTSKNTAVVFLTKSVKKLVCFCQFEYEVYNWQYSILHWQNYT